MASIYQAILEMQARGEAGAVCTIINSSGSTPRHEGSKILVYEDGRFEGSVGGGEVETRIIREALEAIQVGKTRRLAYSMVDPKQGDPGVCGGTLEVYVEPILPDPKILILGGGHVGKAVAHLAKWLGYRVAISDDRAEFCNHESNPDGDEFYPVAMIDLPKSFRFTPRTVIVVTTRGASVDIAGLPAILEQPHAYLGIIGSKRRWAVTRKGLIDQGLTEGKLSNIHTPIGLELNAETPEEIAVSIMAEVLMLRNGGTGKSMKG